MRELSSEDGQLMFDRCELLLQGWERGAYRGEVGFLLPPMATSNSSTCGHPKILHLTRS